MRQGVNNRSKPMFDRALGDVASGLVEMRDDTSRGLRKVLDTMLDGISRDYRKSMIDDQVQLMSDAQVKVKQDVGMIVKKAEAELQLQDLLAEEDTGDDANE